MSKLSHSPIACTQCKGPDAQCAHGCPMDLEDTGAICVCCSECVAKCEAKAVACWQEGPSFKVGDVITYSGLPSRWFRIKRWFLKLVGLWVEPEPQKFVITHVSEPDQ